MARTVRSYFDADGNFTREHRDGKTGWVYSPRTAERAAKRTARALALREARSEASITPDGRMTSYDRSPA